MEETSGSVKTRGGLKMLCFSDTRFIATYVFGTVRELQMAAPNVKRGGWHKKMRMNYTNAVRNFEKAAKFVTF